MAISFVNPADALLLAGEDVLPKIQGRGRAAAPFVPDAGVLQVAATVAENVAGYAAPIVVGVPKDEKDGVKRISSELLTMRAQYAKYAKDHGNTWHLVIRTQDDASSLFIVSGAAPERKVTEDDATATPAEDAE